MKDSSIITLNRESVRNNIRFLKKKMGQKVRISSVVKANAYGHGIEQIVPLFEAEGIDHFAVFDYAEALRVAKSLSGQATIMIMGWISDTDLKNAVRRGFEFYVFTLRRLERAIAIAESMHTKARIHLEAETGMNRSGLNSQDLKEAIRMIRDHPEAVDLSGFCTHLAGAESISNHLRIQKQMKNYYRMLRMVKDADLNPHYRHVANSAAAFVYPKTRLDLVRIGIMQYGFWSSTETFIQYINGKSDQHDPLKRILGWQSKVMSLKEVKTGEFVSYGITYLAQTDIRTALIPVGYSNGYSRSLSNKGRLLIRGHRCSVIGVVNMNMLIADVTHVPDVRIGDEVVIIGKQGDLEIKVTAFSDISEQLNYEILAHLPEKLHRRVLSG